MRHEASRAIGLALRCRRALLAAGFALATVPASAFDYFEHRAIGNRAFELALQRATPATRSGAEKAALALGLGMEVGDRTSPLRLVPLRFGDLAALAGDFADDPRALEDVLKEIVEDLRGAKTPLGRHSLLDTRASALVAATREEWLMACRWAYRLRGTAPDAHDGCFDGLMPEIVPNETRFRSAQAAAGLRASRGQRAGFEQTENYVRLAARNFTHFPQFSWLAYSTHHSEALRLAGCWFRGEVCGGRSGEELVKWALLHEGFAQHFLQDSFASGHIGTQVASDKDCIVWLLGCTPTVARAQQTHDVLNEIGLDVRIDQPQGHLQDIAAVREGWSSFGDGHLFVPEADFHRAVLLQTATASVSEMLLHLEGQVGCKLCTKHTFPVPMEDFGTGPKQAVDLDGPGFVPRPLIAVEDRQVGLTSRSPDPRVPALFQEGWKLSLGYGRETVPSFDRTNSESAKALLMRLDYVHPTAPRWPSVYGFEAWNVPRRGWSYQGSLGWTWPRELASMAFTVRTKLGWRLDENLTRSNPTNERRKSLELDVPIEYTYEIYSPAAIFFHANLLTYSLTDRRAWAPRTRGQTLTIGVRFDLVGL